MGVPKVKQAPDTTAAIIQQAARHLAGAAELQFDKLEDKEIVSVYSLVNGMKKQANKLRDRGKEVAEERIRSYAEEAEDGTLSITKAPDYIAQDEDGKITMTDGVDSVEMRPREKLKFNPEKARAVLQERGLLPLAVERTVRVSDPSALSLAVSRAVEALAGAGLSDAAAELKNTHTAVTETIEELSEEKVEELVKKDQLSVDEATGMFDASTSYAFYG